MTEIYLDNSATTKALKKVITAVNTALEFHFGNPSSLHNLGFKAEKIIKETRNLAAEKLNVKNDTIFFTSGGTESNNLAVMGTARQYQKRGRHIITTSIEHASVLESFFALKEEGFEITIINTDKYGFVSLDKIRESIRPDTILVSIHHVNNELGTIQAVYDIGKAVKEKNKNTFFHVDAVQSFGKIPIEIKKAKIDLLTISAHKIHGPKGTGILYKNNNLTLKPLIVGGGQENGVRSGTENVPGIAGLAAALKSLPRLNNTGTKITKIENIKLLFINKIKENFPKVVINTPEKSAPHIINLSLPGIKGEVLVHALEKEGIYISTGSACHSRAKEKSHVLREIGLPENQIDNTVRVSLSRFNTHEDILTTVKTIKKIKNIYF